MVGGATWLLVGLKVLMELPSFFYQTLLLMPLVTFLIYRYLLRVDKASSFTQFYLLSMVLKLLACLAYILMIVRKDPTGAVSNASFFIVLYAIFTALEVAFLYRKINPR